MISSKALAEAALSRGDYSVCLTLLNELLRENPLNSKEGQNIRMLMITALMGQGNETEAISLCRQLTRSKDIEMRHVAKQLLSVLESPTLERPSNWSIKLPTLDINPQTGNRASQKSQFSSKNKKEKEVLPPTGPTKALGMGFATLVFAILLALTLLLSGCIRINTEVNLAGPDRVAMNWETESDSQTLLPWQIEFENSLKTDLPNLNIATSLEGQQKISTAVMRSKEVEMVLKTIFTDAGKSAGFQIEPPQFSLQEQNWLIGVKQDLRLTIDLTDLPDIPGLKLSLRINPSKNFKRLQTKSLISNQNDADSRWYLQEGELINIRYLHWSWSPLGIGTLLICIFLGLSIILQKLRLKLGFGFPELPP